MRVLVVGSGGREHALAWAIAASPLVDRLFCAPGNAGIAEEAECVPIRATDIAALVGFCQRERIDFVVVGPEAPLVAGLVDALEAEGIAAFGPSAAAAALEGSKGFTKDLCARERHPDRRLSPLHRCRRGQGLYRRARRADRGQGRRAGRRQGRHRRRDPRRGRRRGRRGARSGTFGAAGRRSSSRNFSPARRRASSRWSTARTRCRSPRRRTTSGSATATPVPTPAAWAPFRRRRALTPALEGRVMERIILPTVRGDAAGRPPFKGVLYAGLMLTEARPEAARIQCPLRRPRGAGADDAADQRSAAGADRGA